MKEFISRLTKLRMEAAAAGTEAVALAGIYGHDLEFIGLELMETALKMDEMLSLATALWQKQMNAERNNA